jgi:DNA-binding protein H-NS
MSTTEPLQDLLAKQADLQRQLQALNRQLDESRRTQRAEVITKIKAIMAEHGLTIADLGLAKKGKTRKANNGEGHVLAGRPVAPKYRDPSSGQTWTGRGLQPRWLKAALAAGRTLEEMAV